MANKISIQTPVGELSCELDRKYPTAPGTPITLGTPVECQAILSIYWNERLIATIEDAKPIVRIKVWDTDAPAPSSVLPVFPGYGE